MDAKLLKNTFGVSEEKLTTPFERAKVMLNRWWVIHPEKGILFYAPEDRHRSTRNAAPQCNAKKEIAQHLVDKLYPNCSLIFIEVAYI